LSEQLLKQIAVRIRTSLKKGLNCLCENILSQMATSAWDLREPNI